MSFYPQSRIGSARANPKARLYGAIGKVRHPVLKFGVGSLSASCSDRQEGVGERI